MTEFSIVPTTLHQPNKFALQRVLQAGHDLARKALGLYHPPRALRPALPAVGCAFGNGEILAPIHGEKQAIWPSRLMRRYAARGASYIPALLQSNQ